MWTKASSSRSLLVKQGRRIASVVTMTAVLSMGAAVIQGSSAWALAYGDSGLFKNKSTGRCLEAYWTVYDNVCQPGKPAQTWEPIFVSRDAKGKHIVVLINRTGRCMEAVVPRADIPDSVAMWDRDCRRIPGSSDPMFHSAFLWKAEGNGWSDVVLESVYKANPGFCLDGGNAVYMNACNSGNDYHHWRFIKTS
jgi:hypothetical protein